jgi:hypothetical protein
MEGEGKVEEAEAREGENASEEEEEGMRVGERDGSRGGMTVALVEAFASRKGDWAMEDSTESDEGEKSGAVPSPEEVVVVPVGVGVRPRELPIGVTESSTSSLRALSSASVGSKSEAEPRMWRDSSPSDSRRRRTDGADSCLKRLCELL